MAQIIRFPAPASKLGYKRVHKRAKPAENPGQLQLFEQPSAQILSLAAEAGWFDQALRLDERDDVQAAELYEKAIEAQDCVADAYCNLGIIESQRGNTSKAFDCFTSSLTQDPRHSEAHYNLGNLYFDVNDLRLAQVHYEMAAKIDPGFASVYFNLALVQAINHDLSGAVSTLTQYQSLVSRAEAQNADELLLNLRRSLAAVKKAR
jgi:tetratricopeptide (TPR) repeat protein